MQQQQQSKFYVTFASLNDANQSSNDQQKFDISKMNFRQILNKLSKLLSQYVEIEQIEFLSDMNETTSKEVQNQSPNVGIWQFQWEPNMKKISDFLTLTPYIGTRSLRIFFDQKQFKEENELTEGVLQKMKFNNVQRINQENNNNNLSLNNKQGSQQYWNKGAKIIQQESTNSNLSLNRNYSSKQNSNQQQHQREPETFEEYQKRIEEMQEKLKQYKVQNKELKESNYILSDTIEYLEKNQQKNNEILQKVNSMVKEPLQIVENALKQQQVEQQLEEEEEQKEQN